MRSSIQYFLGIRDQSTRARQPAYFTYNLTGARYYCGGDGNYCREGCKSPIEKGLQRAILAGRISDYTLSDIEYGEYFSKRPLTPAFLIGGHAA